jgi:hypothetical protein
MSSARRTQYRRNDVLANTIKCRIPDTGDWGVVKHRDVSAIDRQLSLLAAVSSSIRRLGGKPSTALIDELLDERIASRRPLGLSSAIRADGNGDSDQRNDRTEDGPSGGVAHWAAPHYPEAL